MYAFGYRIEGKRAKIVALKCLECNHTTRSIYHVNNKICDNCQKQFKPEELSAGEVRLLNPSALNKQLPINQNADYKLFTGASKKSKKIHWSINGKTALCFANVKSEAVNHSSRLICVNCANLKKRGVAR